ncbi:MAG: hypothetical protein AVDCRST_MAG75-168 [uncultured Propionibacteriaceae bacterium]|uniref:EfeO-type cupredoxin-like domain-containing protein n=1 Tax=uncultured Propionibacteriaceae bacterium TaxID=257457 RepID=A0A6J4MXY1_9ACTN|nr:MAG: hypothetical protein AVDCRST_MAG75-168 [uncultured Propionibacteriaceae bacterium]
MSSLARFVTALTWALASVFLSVACTSQAAPINATPASATPTRVTTIRATPTAATTGTPSAQASAVTINLTIGDGEVSPSGDRVDVAKGQTVILKVTSDSDDVIHAHTADEGIEIKVEAGMPASGRFVATETGSFEVESHHLGKIFVILNVR